MFATVLRNQLRLTTRSSSNLINKPLLRTSLAPSTSRLYHERVMDHYENPRNVRIVGIYYDYFC